MSTALRIIDVQQAPCALERRPVATDAVSLRLVRTTAPDAFLHTSRATSPDITRFGSRLVATPTADAEFVA